MAEVGEDEAAGEADGGVEGYDPEARVAEEKIVLVGEGREGGEAAAEAGDEQGAHLGREVDAALGEAEEYADEQASGHVDAEGGPGEAAGGVVGNELAEQVAAAASDGAARHYPKKINPHSVVSLAGDRPGGGRA